MVNVEKREWEGTYASRVDKLREEAGEEKARFIKNQQKEKIRISEVEKEFAKLVISLLDNPAFKKYLEYEAMEIAETLKGAFNDPPLGVLNTSDFGCKMAFNKGRHYQMEHFRKKRNNIVNSYLELNKIEKENVNG